jgi:hypothetical protein
MVGAERARGEQMRNKNVTGTPESAVPQRTGGASGVPSSDAEKALEMRARQVATLGGRPDVVAKRYRILNGGMIVYRNSRTALRAGKIIAEHDYDLKLLRDQGIRLELIQEEPAEAPPQT